MADESSVRVLDRACQVLDCFTQDRPKLGIAELRRITGLPATTVARLVKTLVSQELLEREGELYRLGLRVLVWTAPAMQGSDLLAAAGPAVEQLRDQTRETTGLYVRHEDVRVTVAIALSTYSVIFRGYVGQVRALHAGAAGKVFLAYDQAAYDAAMSSRRLTQFTPHTITSANRMRDELDAVRAQGWAFAAEEVELGLSSVAAPVFSAAGTVAGALAVGGPSFRLTEEMAREFGSLTAAAALSLSQGLGYTGQVGVPPPPI
jgi:IclR family acetate operon transcriptional repressor